jgi:hypothetical protein
VVQSAPGASHSWHGVGHNGESFNEEFDRTVEPLKKTAQKINLRPDRDEVFQPPWSDREEPASMASIDHLTGGISNASRFL